jgi:hypothetical protein
MLAVPVVLLTSASLPMAVLVLPLVLDSSAPSPLAVLSLPIVLLKRALEPMAVLLTPRPGVLLVLLKRASKPSEVFWLPRSPSLGSGVAAGPGGPFARGSRVALRPLRTSSSGQSGVSLRTLRPRVLVQTVERLGILR